MAVPTSSNDADSSGGRGSVEIRDLVAGDLDTVLAINQANLPAVSTLEASSLRAIVEECCIALVAVDGPSVVGFCLVLPPGADYRSVNYRWFCDRYPEFVYLDRVAVASTHQSQGIGARLYSEVERRTSAPVFALEVNVIPRNDGSLRFHERLGFSEVGQQDTPYGSRVSLMIKLLPPANG